MKVICAGMSRTGTKSLAEALRMLGYTNVHDFFEHSAIDGETWKKIFAGEGTKDDFKEMYKDVDAVVDIPACVFWEEILEAYPDAKVILTVRENEDVWYKSMKAYMRFVGENFFFERHRTTGALFYNLTPTGRDYLKHAIEACTVSYGFFPSWLNTNEIFMRNCYRKHNRNVVNGCPTNKLLIFNVKEGWGPLCKFLGKSAPEETSFPHENRPSDAFMLKFADGTYAYDGGLRNRIKTEVSTRMKIIVTVLAIVTSSLLYVLT